MVMINIAFVLFMLFIITKILDSIILMSNSLANGLLLFSALFFCLGLLSIGLSKLKRLLIQIRKYNQTKDK